MRSPTSRTCRFVGIRNYVRLLADRRSACGIMISAFFTFWSAAPLSVAVSLGATLLVDSKLALHGAFYCTILFLPVVTTTLVRGRGGVAPVRGSGLLNHALGARHRMIDWLGDPRWAMLAIVFADRVEELRLQHDHPRRRAAQRYPPAAVTKTASLDGIAGPWTTFREGDAAAAPLPPLDLRHADDRDPATSAVRGALRHDAGRTGRPHAERGAAHVPRGASAGGTSAPAAATAFVLFLIVLALRHRSA